MVAAVWVACLAFAVVYVGRFRADVPMRHDFDVVPYLIGRWPASLDWYWAVQNDHRMPFQKLVIVALAKLTNLDFRADKFFNVAGLAVASLASLIAARRIRGRSSYADAVLPLLLLSASSGAAALDAFAHVLAAVVSLLALALLVLGVARTRLSTLLPFWICVLLLPLAGSSGVVFVPAFVAAGLYAAWVHMRRGDPGGPQAFRLALGLGVAALMLTGVYFYAFPMRDLPRTLPDVVSNFFAFLSLAAGRVEAVWRPLGALVALTGAVTTGLLLRTGVQRPATRPLAMALLAHLGSGALLALSVAWGRACFGPTAALGHRFVPLAAPLLCSAYLAAIVVRPARWSAMLQTAVVLLVAAAYVPNLRYGIEAGRRYRTWAEDVERDLAAGTPPREVVLRNTGFRHQWHVEGTVNRMQMLLHSGVGAFAQRYGPKKGEPVVPRADGR